MKHKMKIKLDSYTGIHKISSPSNKITFKLMCWIYKCIKWIILFVVQIGIFSYVFRNISGQVNAPIQFKPTSLEIKTYATIQLYKNKLIFEKRVEDDVWSGSLPIDYVKTQDDQILPYYGVRGDAKYIGPFQRNHKYSKHGYNGKMNFLFHRFDTAIFKVSVIVGDRQIYAQVQGIANFVELGRESYACATFEVHTSSAIYNIKMTDGCKYIKNLLHRCGINQSYDLNVNNELKQKLIDVFPNKNSEPLQKRLLQTSSQMHAFLPIQEVAKINVDTIINPVELTVSKNISNLKPKLWHGFTTQNIPFSYPSNKNSLIYSSCVQRNLKTNMFLQMVKITSTHTDQLEISPTNNLVDNMKIVDLNELSSKTQSSLTLNEKLTSTHTEQLEISPTNNMVNNINPVVDLNEPTSEAPSKDKIKSRVKKKSPPPPSFTYSFCEDKYAKLVNNPHLMHLPNKKLTSTHTEQLEISPTNNMVDNMNPVVDLNEPTSKESEDEKKIHHHHHHHEEEKKSHPKNEDENSRHSRSKKREPHKDHSRARESSTPQSRSPSKKKKLD